MCTLQVVMLLRRSPVGTLLPKLCEALPMFAARAEIATVLLGPAMRVASRVNALVASALCADTATATAGARSPRSPLTAALDANATPLWLDQLQRCLVLVAAHMAATLTRDGRGVPPHEPSAAARTVYTSAVKLRVPFDRVPGDALTTLHALHVELHAGGDDADDAEAAERALDGTRFFAATDARDPSGETRAMLRAIVQVADACMSERGGQGDGAEGDDATTRVVGAAALERTLRAAREVSSPAARALTLPDAAPEHDIRSVERRYVAALVGGAGMAAVARRAARRLHEEQPPAAAAAELSREVPRVEEGCPLHRVWAHALGIRQWLVSTRQALAADSALSDAQREAAWRAAVTAATEKAELAVECSLRATIEAPEGLRFEGQRGAEDEGRLQLQWRAEELSRLVKGDVSVAELTATARRQELSAKRRLVGMEALQTLLAMHRAKPAQQRDVLHWVAAALRGGGGGGDGGAEGLCGAVGGVGGGVATHYSEGLETADVHATSEVRAGFYSLYAEVARLLHDPQAPVELAIAAMSAWGVRVLPGADHAFLLQQALPTALHRLITDHQTQGENSDPSRVVHATTRTDADSVEVTRVGTLSSSPPLPSSVQLAAALLLRWLAAQTCEARARGEEAKVAAALESKLLHALVGCVCTAAAQLEAAAAATSASPSSARRSEPAHLAVDRCGSCSLAAHALAALHGLATEGRSGAIQATLATPALEAVTALVRCGVPHVAFAALRLLRTCITNAPDAVSVAALAAASTTAAGTEEGTKAEAGGPWSEPVCATSPLSRLARLTGQLLAGVLLSCPHTALTVSVSQPPADPGAHIPPHKVTPLPVTDGESLYATASEAVLLLRALLDSQDSHVAAAAAAVVSASFRRMEASGGSCCCGNEDNSGLSADFFVSLAALAAFGGHRERLRVGARVALDDCSSIDSLDGASSGEQQQRRRSTQWGSATAGVVVHYRRLGVTATVALDEAPPHEPVELPCTALRVAPDLLPTLGQVRARACP